MPSGLVPGALRSKESVNYRNKEQCLTCIYFYGPNSCELVNGNISEDALCDLWSLTRPDGAKGPEFYQEAYDKSKKGSSEGSGQGGISINIQR